MLRVSCALLGACVLATQAAAKSWEGGYAGVSAGYLEAEARYEDPLDDWYGSTYDWVYHGATAGGQIGFNWQTLNSVYGLEGDFMWSGAEIDEIYAADNKAPNSIEWTSSLRARGGFGFGNVFLYHTFGAAVAEFERSWTEFEDASDSWPDLGDTKLGVTAGFGVEGIVSGGWSVRGEFLASRFADNSAVNEDGFPLNIDDTAYTFRAGVNYLFGAGAREGSALAEGDPFDFSGFHIGLSAGGHQATIQSTDIEFEHFGSTHDLLSSGFAGGAELGWANQIDEFVYGLEAGFLMFTGEDRVRLVDVEDSRVANSGLNWSAEARLKAGLAADNMLMYIFSGYAYGDYDLVERLEEDDWDLSGGHSGFVTGAGIERAITPSLTVNIEAAYRAYAGEPTASPTNSSPFRDAAQDISLMAGLNYYPGERGEMGSGALAAGDWGGVFGGIDAIFAYHHGDIFDIDFYDHGATYTIPSFGAGGGAHLGVNWQSDSFVYGVIGDFAFYTNEESDLFTDEQIVKSSLNWMGTFRGRAGLASGDALFYASAGVAFADADLAHRNLDPPGEDFDLGGFRLGWTAGLGAEHRVDERSSLRFETLYTRFAEEETTNANQAICADGFTANPCRMRGYDDNITVKVSYSYRFTEL